MKPLHRRKRQSGNMLIYILGAIFLFGILIVILKGNSQEGAGIDADKVTVSVQQMMSYASELERGVNYILNDNARSEADVRFGHPNSVVNYGLITDTPTRQVFDVTGGGVEYKSPPSGLNDGTQWQFYATTHIAGIGTNTPASSRAELVAVLPNVTRNACERINLTLKQAVDLDEITDTAANGCVHSPGNHFMGTYISGVSTNSLDSTKIPNLPARELCVRCDGDTYHYYRVLLSR